VASQIRKQLDTVMSPKSKLTKSIKKLKATWVAPKFLADVEYRDITSEGLLGASSFKGLLGRINPSCLTCFGLGWVASVGAGMPCECVTADGL